MRDEMWDASTERRGQRAGRESACGGGGHHHLDGYRHGVERGAADDAHVINGVELVPVAGGKGV